MPDVIYDPEQKSVQPLMKATGMGPDQVPIQGVVYAMENKAHVRQCCTIIRDICKRRGIAESDVPCIHRLSGRFRYWDVRQGQSGASNYCVELCSTQWRIATADEQKAHTERLIAARAQAAEEARRLSAAKLVAESSIGTMIAAAMKNETNPSPALAGGKK